MALRGLVVEHFRGIRAARLTLDHTTVLFGENGCGTSSLLEALSLVLSPAAGARAPVFEPWHFHRPGGPATAPPGPIRIEIALRESRGGSWDRLDAAPLVPLLATRGAGLRTLVVEVTAEPAAGPGPVAAHWQIRGPGGCAPRDDTAALEAVRRLNPLLWLRGGALTGQPDPASEAPAHAPAEAAEVLASFTRLLAGDTHAPDHEIESGYAAAERLLTLWAPDASGRRPATGAAVTDILGRTLEAASPRSARRIAPARATTPQKLGVFLLMARLLGRLRDVSPGARPTIVFEEPEAGLHPMVLASLWGMLEGMAAQRVVTTHSGTLLAAAPLASLRRLVRGGDGTVREFRVPPGRLTRDEVRKVSYHLRARRGAACFARCWLLVEGETEFWLLPELAHLCGVDLAQEGVACVEFAQCGLRPLIKLAGALGIEWHVLTDGDRAGVTYGRFAQEFAPGGAHAGRLTQLAEPDIEHSFWRCGYAPVFERLAGSAGRGAPRRVIGKAIERHSKPGVAFELLAAAAAPGSPGPPPPLQSAIERCVEFARRVSSSSG